MLSMIDQAVTAEQFAAFPPDIAARLLTAAEADIVQWGDLLLDAWMASSEDDIRRARHSMKGLCGNFGAFRLLEMAETDLDTPEVREEFTRLRAATLHAIRIVALGLPVQEPSGFDPII